MTTPSNPSDAAASEQAKSEAEKFFPEREIAVQERAQSAREAEIDIKGKVQAASQWSNPLIVAIVAASIAAIGTTSVAFLNGVYGRQIDAQRSEEALILEVIKTGDPDKAAVNLKFLLDAGLIADPDTRHNLQVYLNAKRPPGTGAALPTTSNDSVIEEYKQRLKAIGIDLGPNPQKQSK